jgi:hypothetical protein
VFFSSFSSSSFLGFWWKLFCGLVPYTSIRQDDNCGEGFEGEGRLEVWKMGGARESLEIIKVCPSVDNAGSRKMSQAVKFFDIKIFPCKYK